MPLKTKIAAQAGESLSRAFEQKIELRGLDASKLNPFVQQLREAENALAAVKAQQAQAAGQNAFLDSLRSQTEVIGKTKTELLELKAAQLGMSTAAAPYIAKLKEAEVGIGKVGMSAAQTANAMRTVPAQFTDIVVSLQSGQAPLTVLLQQGGQLKDMFGGAGNAAKALGSYVLGLVNPFTVAAAAVAALGAAYYQGSKEQDAFVKAIVLTGNASGMTTSQLHDYARQIDAVIGTQAQAAAGWLRLPPPECKVAMNCAATPRPPLSGSAPLGKLWKRRPSNSPACKRPAGGCAQAQRGHQLPDHLGLRADQGAG